MALPLIKPRPPKVVPALVCSEPAIEPLMIMVPCSKRVRPVIVLSLESVSVPAPYLSMLPEPERTAPYSMSLLRLKISEERFSMLAATLPVVPATPTTAVPPIRRIPASTMMLPL